MLPKKILLLGAGYIAGNVVSSMYSKGKAPTKKVQSKKDAKAMLDHFLETQKNFIRDMEDKYVSDENKEKLAIKKQQFKEASEKYLRQGQEMIDEVRKNEMVDKASSTGSNIISKVFGGIKSLFAKEESYAQNVQMKADELEEDFQNELKKTEKELKKKS